MKCYELVEEQKMKSRKGVAIVVVVVILIVASIFFYSRANHSAVKYRTATVERGDISTVVSATGTINAVTTVQVGSQVSGTIARLYADFNSVVKKGQVVAQLDSTFLKAQVQEAEANLERAIVSVNGAKRALTRAEDLLTKKLISQAEYDDAQTNYELAVAQEKQSRAALDRAKTNLRYATIHSPIDGVVISRNVDVGQTVAASLQAPTLFTIANDLTKMKLETNIDEADIGKVAEDQSATFTVDAYPDQQFQGTVAQIRLAPIIVQNVVTYNVIIEVANPDLKLMPGMTANVSILVAHREKVLRVPNAALRFQPAVALLRFNERQERRGPVGEMGSRMGGSSPMGQRMREMAKGSRVWILSPNGKPEPRMLQLGITDGSFTEVVRGDLEEGQEVIVSAISSGSTTQMASPAMPGAPSGGRRGPF